MIAVVVFARWSTKIVKPHYVEVRNESDVPALLIRLNLKNSTGAQILPVIYSDNYFSLLPNERKMIRISYRIEDCEDNKPRMEVSAFNQQKSALSQ